MHVSIATIVLISALTSGFWLWLLVLGLTLERESPEQMFI